MKTLLPCLLAALLASGARAQPGATPATLIPQLEALPLLQIDRAEAMASPGHPNEMWRYRALRALKLHQAEAARRYFRFASRYGDKFSQHALSLMMWNGVGGPVDRAQAYAWSDLAAERGYRDLLLVREKMWMQLDAAQKARAMLAGQALYAEYADAVARPRQAWAMRRAFAAATGSRVGATSDRLRFEQGDVSAEYFFVDKRWNDEYWREQDRQWKARVIVAPPQPLRDAEPDRP
ncbi:hypothetical protein [Luteimonas vadosa]|uniref:Sel1 repeat family protein n=1 Tax=Luteimonas vadosa TaxID=1165507 RepID=A0ABP9DUM9_9GAMM